MPSVASPFEEVVEFDPHRQSAVFLTGSQRRWSICQLRQRLGTPPSLPEQRPGHQRQHQHTGQQDSPQHQASRRHAVAAGLHSDQRAGCARCALHPRYVGLRQWQRIFLCGLVAWNQAGNRQIGADEPLSAGKACCQGERRRPAGQENDLDW